MPVREIFDAVLALEEERVPALVKEELEQGTPPAEILNDGLIAALDEVGRRFSDGELFLPEMLMAGQAMTAGLEVLKPHLTAGETSSRGTVVIGTVAGDLHDIGKNLVATMLEGGGFRVVDVGIDVPVEKFVAAVEEQKAALVALSALLTTTMPAMQATVAALRARGLSVKVIVGGAPISEAFAAQIGADGYAEDAPGAVRLARTLVGA